MICWAHNEMARMRSMMNVNGSGVRLKLRFSEAYP